MGLGEIVRQRAAERALAGTKEAANKTVEAVGQAAHTVDSKLKISERTSHVVEVVKESQITKSTTGGWVGGLDTLHFFHCNLTQCTDPMERIKRSCLRSCVQWRVCLSSLLVRFCPLVMRCPFSSHVMASVLHLHPHPTPSALLSVQPR